jgi:hypothetical protein
MKLFGRKGISVGNDVLEDPLKSKPKGTLIGRVGVIGDNVLFFVLKDPHKWRWVAIKEIPIYDIARIESSGNELSVIWKGGTDIFFMEKDAESLGRLRDQVRWMLRERENSLGKTGKAGLIRTEVLEAINASIFIIDALFDVFFGLQNKRIDWERLEANSNVLGENFSLKTQIMPHLSLDFSKVTASIKRQDVRETAREACSILKAVYEYFYNLIIVDELNENHPNFQNGKDVILGYYLLNDLLFGKVAGMSENLGEKYQLETILQNLSNNTNFKVDFKELKGRIDKMGFEVKSENVIADCRDVFKQQLKQLC